MLSDQDFAGVKKAILALSEVVPTENERQALIVVTNGFIQAVEELNAERKFSQELLALAERIVNR
jgi:hypothetical protein